MSVTKNILSRLGLGREVAVDLQNTKELVDRLYTFKQFNSIQPAKTPAQKTEEKQTEIPVFSNITGAEQINKNDLRSVLKTAGVLETAQKATQKATGFFGGKTVEPTSKTPTVETQKPGLKG